MHTGENGRGVSYDNQHGYHHRHYFGVVAAVEFTSFDDIEDQFQADWAALRSTVWKKSPLKQATNKISFAEIAGRLHRDRSAVKRDVDQFARVRLVTIETRTLPGHGHMKEIRAAAGIFRLEAMVM